MGYILDKPVRTITALTLAAGLVVDAVDGAVDFDFDGAARGIEAVASAPSSGPSFTVMYVDNTVIGNGNEVTEPDGQRTGELVPSLKRFYPLDDAAEQKTDPSSGSVVLRGWSVRST